MQVRSLSVLEGIALASDPNYKVLGATYPWIARRLLTDRSPELRVRRASAQRLRQPSPEMTCVGSLQLCTISLQAHGVALLQSMQLSRHHPAKCMASTKSQTPRPCRPAGHADAAAVQGRPLPVLAPGVAAGAGGARPRPLHPGPGARRQRRPRLRPGGKPQFCQAVLLFGLQWRVAKAVCSAHGLPPPDRMQWHTLHTCCSFPCAAARGWA
jgi:hypothetical protein